MGSAERCLVTYREGKSAQSAQAVVAMTTTSPTGGMRDDVDVVEHRLARARVAEEPEADLEVWAGRDADDAVPDAGYLLALDDMGPHRDQVWPGVAVVDGLAGQRAGGDLQHRGVRSESSDAFLDDGARAHGEQGRASRG